MVRGQPQPKPCDRMEEACGARLSSRSQETYAWIGELGPFSPGLKPGHGKIKRSRGFENPLPRTESPGLAPIKLASLRGSRSTTPYQLPVVAPERMMGAVGVLEPLAFSTVTANALA
jgi:hypothetical protein